jgi:hypothetical protein
MVSQHTTIPHKLETSQNIWKQAPHKTFGDQNLTKQHKTKQMLQLTNDYNEWTPTNAKPPMAYVNKKQFILGSSPLVDHCGDHETIFYWVLVPLVYHRGELSCFIYYLPST